MASNEKTWNRIHPLSHPKSIALVLSIAAISLFAAAAKADDRSQDVWLLSTRCAPRCRMSNSSPRDIRYSQLRDDCRWETADEAKFQIDDQTPTIIFIHGNKIDACRAASKGMYVYRSIRSAVGCRPFRYVIWSWPAGKVCRRIRNDAILKAGYSDAESYYLAAWMHDKFPPSAKVSLAGHSFGARIIAGAMQLLAGGRVAGRTLPAEIVNQWKSGKRNEVRAVFLAAALDADWLARGSRRGEALTLLNKMLITRNCCDRALRWYPRLYGRCGPQAMGFIGPCGVGNAENVRVMDVTCAIGKTHDLRCYCAALSADSQWTQYTFLDER